MKDCIGLCFFMTCKDQNSLLCNVTSDANKHKLQAFKQRMSYRFFWGLFRKKRPAKGKLQIFVTYLPTKNAKTQETQLAKFNC